MRAWSLFFIFLSVLFLTGCNTTAKRQLKQASVLSHAVNDSIKAGRFDRAKEFSNQLVKLTPPIKKTERIVVNRFVSINVEKKGIFTKDELVVDKQFVVLPEDFKGFDVIIKNDDKFKEVLNSNPVLKKEEEKIDQKVLKIDDNINNILLGREKELEKSREQKTSWFGGIFQFFKSFLGFGLIGTIILLIGLLIFAPQLLPLVFNIFGFIVNWIISLFVSLFNIIKNLFK